MQYNLLGKSGLKVSRLGLGSWLTFGLSLDLFQAKRIIIKAYELGINYFDNAEIYANGQAEEIMGAVFGDLSISRLSYIIASKYYWGLNDGPNQRKTLNRKYLMHAVDGSLQRLRTDFIDIAYCHRPDVETPIEETAAAMDDLIRMGKILYWGTSEWGASELYKLFAICEKYNYRKPIVDQTQYNLLCRKRVEEEYKPLIKEKNLGLIAWSPLASGLLTGKYQNGIPQNSRFSSPEMEWLRKVTLTPDNLNRVQSFVALAQKLGYTPSQLAIAWCLRNSSVNSVLLGISHFDQIEESVKSLYLVDKIETEVWKQIESIFGWDLIRTIR